MVSPAGEEQIDLPEEAQHRWDASKREKAEAEPKCDQGVLLVEPRVIGDAITSGADREQDDAGESSQVHEQVSGHVEHHRGETVFGAAHQTDHHESGLPDGAVGKHPLHRGLSECNDVAEGHAQHRENGEKQFPLGVEAAETANEQSKGQGESRGLRTDRQKGHHRSRRTLVDIRCPLVERHRGDFEGHCCQHEHQRQSSKRRGAGHQ